MTRIVLMLCSMLLAGSLELRAQTVILNFEAPATNTDFQYFGSALDGQFTGAVANPSQTGENTSAMVLKMVKPVGAQVWAGAASNPEPGTPVNLTGTVQVSLKVYMDHIGNVALKLEDSPDGGDNWLQTVANTKINEWETLHFDVSIPSEEAPNTAAAGHIYQRVVLFTDFGSSPATEQTYYIDDITVEPVISCQTILDFESAGTSTTFQYFGSSIDGQLSSTIANPNPAGINTSSTVLNFLKPANCQTWAGAFSNPGPSIPINLSNGGQIRIKVLTDHPGNLTAKLEGGANGAPNWVLTQDINTTGEWVELSFDTGLPSIEAPNQPAGHEIYATLTLFFDFGISPATDQVFYLDDVEVCSAGAPANADVTFKLDMSQYAGSFTQPYVSGSFNSWSGDANPLADPDGDHIWEATVTMPVGLYEFKFTLDNWAASEAFPVTAACTNTTYDGANVFTNRKLVVSDNATVGPVCFNSCYACGSAVKITYNLGMGAVVPNPDGVWLAGGAEFGPPGGRFKMSDDNGDGVYTLTIERERGYGGYYDFANGPCADYSCKEDLSGQPCAQTQNYNDRWLDPVQQDTVIATCFGSCATNTDCTIATHNPSETAGWLKVQPNVVDDVVGIYLQSPGEKALVRIYNTAGQLVFQTTGSDGQFNISTAAWTPGFYIVRVQQGVKTASERMVKI